MTVTNATLPTYLETATMNRLKARDESAMRDTCQFHRINPGGMNPDNSPADGTVTITTSPCRMTRLALHIRGTEQIFGFVLTGEYQAVLRVPLGTDVETTDIVVFGGDQYEIVGTNVGRTFATSLGLALRLIT